MAARSTRVSRVHELVIPTWAAIVQAVAEGHPLTYTQLAEAVGSHRQSPALHGALAVIQERCRKRGCPDLSAAVVGARSGVPGFGRLGRREKRDAWMREWHAVQAFEWAADFPAIVPDNGRASGGW